MTPKHRTIGRIAKVNHAGEYGAIRIYGAQIFVSRAFWKNLVPMLSELRDHEVEHCALFEDAMRVRDTRPCATMSLWSIGGWMLGFVTALLGPKMIWTCTEVVEDTVHRHLNDQLAFLDGKDQDLFDLIEGIRDEEEGHLSLAQDNVGTHNGFTKTISSLIRASVNLVIWLSTHGDSARMHHDLKGASI